LPAQFWAVVLYAKVSVFHFPDI